jgi:glutaredoxin
MIKLFFKTLRLVLLPFMLLWSKLGTPRGLKRAPAEQEKVNLDCQALALYHFPTCPFCIKVRHEMARLSLPIELRNAQHQPEHRAALLQGGGKIQAPCLRIKETNGSVRWLYESSDIMQYLQQRFA